MTSQRLYQTITQTADASGVLVFTFPAVPQGLVWSGALCAYASQPASVFNTKFLDGIRWALTKNNTPVIAYSGEAVAYDVQAVAQEVLTLTGHGVPLGTQVTVTWFGQSDDAADAPILTPRLYQTMPPYIQAYTSTPGAPLDVVQYPDPGDVQIAYALNGLPSTVVDLIPNGQSVGYRIWSATINASCTVSTTATASIPFLATLESGGTTLLGAEPMAIQSTATTVTVTLDCKGYQTAIGQGVQLRTGTFTGGTSVRANASVVVSRYT